MNIKDIMGPGAAPGYVIPEYYPPVIKRL